MLDVVAILRRILQTLSIPFGALPSENQIFLGAQVPTRVQEVIDDYVGGSPGAWPAAACILYGKPSGQYWFDAVVFPNTSQITVAIIRGVVDGASQGQVTQVWRYRSISGLSRVAIGDDGVFESVTVGGPVANRPGLVMQYNPLVTPATTDLGSQFGSDVTNIYGGSGSGSINLSANSVFVNGFRHWRIDRGNVSVTIVNLSQFLSDTINFGTPFASPPHMFMNINSGAGGTARWFGRCFSITTTGFRIFAWQSENVATSFNNVDFQWVAIGE